jgi:hypothetical protein
MHLQHLLLPTALATLATCLPQASLKNMEDPISDMIGIVYEAQDFGHQEPGIYHEIRQLDVKDCQDFLDLNGNLHKAVASFVDVGATCISYE